MRFDDGARDGQPSPMPASLVVKKLSKKFYAEPSFLMNSYSYLTGAWKDWSELVGELMANYD
jgi:hypothetical protein